MVHYKINIIQKPVFKNHNCKYCFIFILFQVHILSLCRKIEFEMVNKFINVFLIVP